MPLTGHEFRTEAGIVFLAIHQLFRGLANFEEDIEKIKALFGRGKKDKMGYLADVELALAAAKELRIALPILGQAAADVKQAIADKADPAKATADLAAALDAVKPLLDSLLAAIPAAA